MAILNKERTPAELTVEVDNPGKIAASSILGQRVKNPAGEDMGFVENLMINIHTGRLEYVVIRFEGFLGFGGKLFAIPFRHLSVPEGKKGFVLDRSRKELEAMPGFDKDHWPYTNSHYFKDLDMLWNSKTVLQA